MSGWEVERLVSRTKEVGCVPHPTKDDANGETGRLAAPLETLPMLIPMQISFWRDFVVAVGAISL